MVFKKGESGNPKGRAFGSRSKLTEDFLRDLHAHWEQHGVDALDKLQDQRPHDYVKLVAAIIPKHFNVKVNEYDDYTDEQLRQQFNALVAALAAAGGVEPGGAVSEAAPAAPLLLPALSQTG